MNPWYLIEQELDSTPSQCAIGSDLCVVDDSDKISGKSATKDINNCPQLINSSVFYCSSFACRVL